MSPENFTRDVDTSRIRDYTVHHAYSMSDGGLCFFPVILFGSTVYTPISSEFALAGYTKTRKKKIRYRQE